MAQKAPAKNVFGYFFGDEKSNKNTGQGYDEIKPSTITRRQIDEYLLYCIREKRITESYQNQIMSAIKMFFAEVVKQEHKVIGLFQPKRPQKIPQALTEEEVVKLLTAIDNLKHRCILALI